MAGCQSPGGLAVESSRPRCTCFTWRSLRFRGAESKGLHQVLFILRYSEIFWDNSKCCLETSLGFPGFHSWTSEVLEKHLGFQWWDYHIAILHCSMNVYEVGWTYYFVYLFVVSRSLSPRVHQPRWVIAQQPVKVGSSIRQTQHTQLAEGWPSEQIYQSIQSDGISMNQLSNWCGFFPQRWKVMPCHGHVLFQVIGTNTQSWKWKQRGSSPPRQGSKATPFQWQDCHRAVARPLKSLETWRDAYEFVDASWWEVKHGSTLVHFSLTLQHPRQATQNHCQFEAEIVRRKAETLCLGMLSIHCNSTGNHLSSHLLWPTWTWPSIGLVLALNFARTVPSRLQLVSRLWQSEQVRLCWAGWNSDMRPNFESL